MPGWEFTNIGGGDYVTIAVVRDTNRVGEVRKPLGSPGWIAYRFMIGYDEGAETKPQKEPYLAVRAMWGLEAAKAFDDAWKAARNG